MDDERTRRLNKRRANTIRNQRDTKESKSTRRKLNYVDKDSLDIPRSSVISCTPPLECNDHVTPNYINQPQSDKNKNECLLLQIPRSVSFHILSFLTSIDYARFMILDNETMDMIKEELIDRIEKLYKNNNMPIQYFVNSSFWRKEWWYINTITNSLFDDKPDNTIECERIIQSPLTISSPLAVSSALSPRSHTHRSTTKVLEMHKNDPSYLKEQPMRLGDVQTSSNDTQQSSNLSSDHCGRNSWTERPRSKTRGGEGGGGVRMFPLFSPTNKPINSKIGSPLTPHCTQTPILSSSSSSSSSSASSSAVSVSTSCLTSSWLRELHSWETSMNVPRDGSLSEVCLHAPPNAHIFLAPGVHVLNEQLVINKNLQIIGSVNNKNIPVSVIRGSQGVFRISKQAHLGLYGVAIWCHSPEFSRRNAVIVDSHATFYATYSHIKCVSGRYCGGMLVQNFASVLLHECTISACTGSGVILFGIGQFQHCDFYDNHFNGIEVQKGGEAYVNCCHVHSNGYCNNEDDLGSGVTCCGGTSFVWLRNSLIHGNQGGGLIVQSEAKAIAQGCQV